jgi:hypothetical protein
MSIIHIITQQIIGNHSSILEADAVETAKDIESALKLNGILGRAEVKAAKGVDLPSAATEGDRFVFEVDELPVHISPIALGRVPARRTQVVEFAKAHPGQWIKYPPTKEDPYKKASDLASRAKKAKAGFCEGLDACVRDHVIWLRYVGEEAGE